MDLFQNTRTAGTDARVISAHSSGVLWQHRAGWFSNAGGWKPETMEATHSCMDDYAS